VLRDLNHTVVMQDVDALNLLQRSLDAEPAGYQELSINIDTGGLAARRILARLAAEGERATVPATVNAP
jgi:vanillate O-demethylase monooxygenase subunit